MNARRFWTRAVVAGLLGLGLAGFASGDGSNERTGVQNKDGNPSPPAGSAQPGGISNVDDYTQQQDQIQIPGDKTGIIKVLRVNQKNLVNDYVVRVFPIRNAVPNELRQAFREIAAAEGGRTEIILDREKKEFFLWVAAPKFQMPYIETALKELDEPWIQDAFDGSTKSYYKAKFRDISKIAELAKIPGASAIGFPDDNLIVLDPIGNAALVGGEPYRVKAFMKYAAETDVPVPQILLEAAVYEVEVSRETRLGLDYIAWKNGPGRNLFDFIGWGLSFEQDYHQASSIFDPFVAVRTVGTASPDGHASGWYRSASFLLTAAYFDFLEGAGRARVVTRGKVLVRNGQTGTLSATDQVLYLQTTPNEATTPVNGTAPGALVPTGGDLPIHTRELDQDQSLPVGFTMAVRPYIARKMTELNVTLNLNNIVGQCSTGTPVVRTHSLVTTVLVQDGEPICIGGLRRTEDVKQTQKVPVLGSIPVLGWLFGHEATAKRETEVVVVLTPRVRLASEADLELANEEDKQIRAQVQRLAKLGVPPTEFGFDQWLIGGDRQGPEFKPAPAPAPKKEAAPK